MKLSADTPSTCSCSPKWLYSCCIFTSIQTQRSFQLTLLSYQQILLTHVRKYRDQKMKLSADTPSTCSPVHQTDYIHFVFSPAYRQKAEAFNWHSYHMLTSIETNSYCELIVDIPLVCSPLEKKHTKTETFIWHPSTCSQAWRTKQAWVEKWIHHIL